MTVDPWRLPPHSLPQLPQLPTAHCQPPSFSTITTFPPSSPPLVVILLFLRLARYFLSLFHVAPALLIRLFAITPRSPCSRFAAYPFPSSPLAKIDMSPAPAAPVTPWRRDLGSTVADAGHTLSSWDNCMDADYCKYVWLRCLLNERRMNFRKKPTRSWRDRLTDA
jgi:hypothetical protein